MGHHPGRLLPFAAPLAVVLVLAFSPGVAHAQDAGGDLFSQITSVLEHLPDGITDGVRDSLKRDVLPAFWAQITPDLPGILARGFLMLLGGFARWWMDGLDPVVQAQITQNSLLVQTPLAATAGQSDVQDMLNGVKVLCLLLLPPAIAWSALLVYAGIRDLQSVVRDSMVAVVGVLAIDRLYAGLLAIVNALCLAVLGGARGLPGWETMHTTAQATAAPTASQQALMDGAVVLVYAVAAGLTAVAALLHLVAVVIFFVCGPLAAVCYATPFLRPAANALAIGFVTAAVVKLFGAIALRLGATLISSAVAGSGDAQAIVWPLLVGVATAGAYSVILGRALFFGSGNVLSQGRTVVRTVAAGTTIPTELRHRLATRDAARLEKRSASATGGGALPTPTMFTHAHSHGHLIGRGDAAPTPAPAPTAPRATTRST